MNALSLPLAHSAFFCTELVPEFVAECRDIVEDHDRDLQECVQRRDSRLQALNLQIEFEMKQIEDDHQASIFDRRLEILDNLESRMARLVAAKNAALGL